ncbi:MAG: hypothetical protein ACOZNI_30290 [Myxococcota bacterium]
MNWTARIVLAAGCLVCASPARAAPGEHIPAGDAVVTPRVSLGLEYSSNAYRSDVVDGDAGGTDVKLAPGADVRLDRDDLDVSAAATYELRKYFAADDVPLDRYDDFSVRADVDAWKLSLVGVQLHEAVGLANVPVDAESEVHAYTKQFRNQTTGFLAVRPRRSLDVLAGGRYALDDYQTAGAGGSDGLGHYNTRHTYGPAGTLAWKFFPRTALALDVSWEHAVYADKVVEVEGGEDIPFADHDMVRIVGGLRGQVTERASVRLMGGYGSAVFDETSVGAAAEGVGADLTGLEHLLLDATLQYSLTETQGLSLSFQKNFRNSFFTNYVSYVKGSVATDARLTERIGVVGEVVVAGEAFRGTAIRNDVALGVKGDFAYYLQDWASISAGATWNHRWSSDDVIEYDEVAVRVLGNFVY